MDTDADWPRCCAWSGGMTSSWQCKTRATAFVDTDGENVRPYRRFFCDSHRLPEYQDLTAAYVLEWLKWVEAGTAS